MKNATLTNALRFEFFPVFCFLFWLCVTPALGQSNLVADGASYTINQNGSYQDFLIPANVTYGQLKVTAHGADGGKRHYSVCGTEEGGGGATAVGTFNIGCGANDLKPGGTIRFIDGKSGTSCIGGTISGGGGGGGTGILYKAPGGSDWVILAVGGGGGGAYLDGVCVGTSGKVGSSTTSGSDGKGNSAGHGGSDGEGGVESDGYSSRGGGGAFSDGRHDDNASPTDCDYNQGHGKKGGTTGGNGGDDNWCMDGQDGGFGFGGGGFGGNYGGGGGGYSGGGGGGSSIYGGGGGGGGGSYVNPIADSWNTEAGETTSSPNHGYCIYQFLNNTGSPIASVNAVCQNITVEIDNYPTGSKTVTVEELGGNSTVTCGSVVFPIASYTFTSAQVSPAPVQTPVVVSDELGNISSCMSQVTLKTLPVAKCKDLTVNLNSSGSVTIPVSQVNDGSNDPDGGPVSVVFLVFGGDGSSITLNCANVGTQSLTVFVTDDEGEYNYCSTNITVNDVNAPTVICKTATLNLGSNGSGTLSATSVFQSGTDNCSIASKSVSPNTFTCNNLGANTVTLTVNDGHGNTANCNTTVTVADNTAPSITCKNATVNLNSSGSASISPSTVYNTGSDACGNVILNSVTPNTFNCSNLGANIVTLNAGDGSGNTATCTATVTVADNTAPTVTCKYAHLNLDASGQATLDPMAMYQSGSDNCSITSKTVSPGTFNCSNREGNNIVTLTASDAAGNTATCTAHVYVHDVTPPTFSCKNATVNLNSSGSASISPSAVYNTGSDACGNVNLNSVTPNTFNCSNLGANTVTLNAGDGFGNTATCTATVTIVDNTAPSAVCQNTTVQLNAQGSVTVTASSVTGSSSDNCAITTRTPTSTTYTATGTYNYNITIKDASNNSSSCVSQVTVQAYSGSNGSGGDRSPADANDPTAFNFSISPNPTAGDASVQFDLPADQPFVIEVLDMQGRMVLSDKGIGMEGENSFPLRSSNFAQGVYLVYFQSGVLRSQKRLMVQK